MNKRHQKILAGLTEAPQEMTPEDQTTLRQALSRVNAPRSGDRQDAALKFKYLNRKYTKPVVDEARRKMEES